MTDLEKQIEDLRLENEQLWQRLERIEDACGWSFFPWVSREKIRKIATGE